MIETFEAPQAERGVHFYERVANGRGGTVDRLVKRVEKRDGVWKVLTGNDQDPGESYASRPRALDAARGSSDTSHEIQEQQERNASAERERRVASAEVVPGRVREASLAAKHYDDWLQRWDGERPEEVRRGDRIVRVRLTDEQYNDLLADAKIYGAEGAEDVYGEDNDIVQSARRNIFRISEAKPAKDEVEKVAIPTTRPAIPQGSTIPTEVMDHIRKMLREEGIGILTNDLLSETVNQKRNSKSISVRPGLGTDSSDDLDLAIADAIDAMRAAGYEATAHYNRREIIFLTDTAFSEGKTQEWDREKFLREGREKRAAERRKRDEFGRQQQEAREAAAAEEARRNAPIEDNGKRVSVSVPAMWANAFFDNYPHSDYEVTSDGARVVKVDLGENAMREALAHARKFSDEDAESNLGGGWKRVIDSARRALPSLEDAQSSTQGGTVPPMSDSTPPQSTSSDLDSVADFVQRYANRPSASPSDRIKLVEMTKRLRDDYEPVKFRDMPGTIEEIPARDVKPGDIVRKGATLIAVRDSSAPKTKGTTSWVIQGMSLSDNSNDNFGSKTEYGPNADAKVEVWRGLDLNDVVKPKQAATAVAEAAPGMKNVSVQVRGGSTTFANVPEGRSILTAVKGRASAQKTYDDLDDVRRGDDTFVGGGVMKMTDVDGTDWFVAYHDYNRGGTNGGGSATPAPPAPQDDNGNWPSNPYQVDTSEMTAGEPTAERPHKGKTPVQVDKEAARLYTDLLKAEARLGQHFDTMRNYYYGHATYRNPHPTFRDEKYRSIDDIEVELRRKLDAGELTYNPAPRDVEHVLGEIVKQRETNADLRAKYDLLQEEFKARGGWNQAFLATSMNGHIHKDMYCSTCNKMGKQTEFAWITDFSGKNQEAIIEAAGERACTTCFPDAPVSTLGRPTKMFSDDEKAAQAARDQRAIEKSERDAKKAAKAPTKSGQPLTVQGPYRLGSKETINTEVSAKTALLDSMIRAVTYQGMGRDEDIEIQRLRIKAIADALAEKNDMSVPEYLESIEKNYKAKVKRDTAQTPKAISYWLDFIGESESSTQGGTVPSMTSTVQPITTPGVVYGSGFTRPFIRAIAADGESLSLSGDSDDYETITTSGDTHQINPLLEEAAKRTTGYRWDDQDLVYKPVPIAKFEFIDGGNVEDATAMVSDYGKRL